MPYNQPSGNEQEPQSVAELIKLQSGDWVNGGFTAAVVAIEQKQSKAGKPFWKIKLGDTTGSAAVTATMFFPPKFKIGDRVDFTGAGIKFKNENYGPEVSISDKTHIEVMGHSVHHEEQQERAAACQPSVSGALPNVNGQTVGMAIKLATDLMHDSGTPYMPENAEYWKTLHEVSSDIIRVARLLEHGRLAPSVKERLEAQGEDIPCEPVQVQAKAKGTNSPTKAQEPVKQEGKAPSKPLPPPPPQAFPTDGPDQDVPF